MKRTPGVKTFAAGVLFLCLSISSLRAADPNVAAPVFTPGGGIYNTEKNVAINCATPGATIRYTLNGSDPNYGTVCEPNSIVFIDCSLTLKAVAWKDGFCSSLKSAVYSLVVATPAFSVPAGTYNAEQNVVITCATPGATIHYNTNGVNPVLSDPVIASGDSVYVDRSLTLKAGAWKGSMTPSSVRSAAYQIVVATPTFSVAAGTYNTEKNVVITSATPGATIHYTTNGLDPTLSDPVIASGDSVYVDRSMTLKAKAWKGSWMPSGVKTAAYQLIVAAPVFSPPSGTYYIQQNVTITDGTPDATIHYTTNGLDPTESDPVIASGDSIYVDHSLTLKAKAWKGAMTASTVRTAAYQIMVDTLAFSLAAGSYNTEQNVVIACRTPGATIRYTLDGSDPNNGTIYEPNFIILIDHSLTLKARAWKDNLPPSPIRSAFYNLAVAVPIITPPGGTYAAEQNVMIACATPGATIRYTLDGADPNDGTIYEPNSMILIDHSLTLKAKAWKGNMTPTGIVSASYDLAVVAPVFTPDAGAYLTDQAVVITCVTPRAEIHYTWSNDPANIPDPELTDPTIENGGSLLAPVDPPTYLKARAWKTGFQNSSVTTAYYRLAHVIYVNAAATGANNGTSWTDAYTDPNTALTEARDGDEIWVAAGVYHPTSDHGLGAEPDQSQDTLKHFRLKNGVGLYGGFAGNETSRDQRNWQSNVTVLSGNFGAVRARHIFYHPSDTNGPSDPNELNPNLDGTAVLDGFTVCDGGVYYEGSEYTGDVFGGGMYNNYSSPTIRNCIFDLNHAYNEWGIPEFGVYLKGTGGAIMNENYSSPVLINCTFRNNTSYWGGAMANFDNSSPQLVNCTFVGNRADGGYYGSKGPAMYTVGNSNPLLINCAFSNNNSTGYYGDWMSAIYSDNSTPVLTNCILWDYDAIDGSCSISYSNARYNHSGVGNISADPLFVDAAAGDLRLLPGSPCIDAGSNSAVPAEVTSDLIGNPRFVDDPEKADTGLGTPPIVDIGAYEGSAPNAIPNLVFDPDGGTASWQQHVVITCAVPGAAIHYTTNGLDPTESDTIIASGGSVDVDHNLILKARAWKEGFEPSPVKFAVFQIFVRTPEFGVSAGAYNTEKSVRITCGTAGATIHYTTNGLDPTETDPVIASGDSVYVDRSMTLKAKAWKVNYLPSGIKTAGYELIVIKPVFSPDGGYFLSNQNVVITCATPGAEIHYTTDDTDPDQSDPIIENGGSLIVTSSPPTILKAKAFRAGWTADVRTAIYYQYAGGSGTPQDPWQINSKAVLLGVAAYPSHYDRSFMLTDDINLDEQVFTTAVFAASTGLYSTFEGDAFTGTFDGNGHTVFNFTINSGENHFIGLFGYTGWGSQIKNLNLENVSITGHMGRPTGGLAGHSNSIISNCSVSGVLCNYSQVGGLVGLNYGTVNHCFSSGTVNNKYYGFYVGGLVGWNKGSINESYSTCNVYGSEDIGGLVGIHETGNINNCYANGCVDGECYVGGLVGYVLADIRDCCATGHVSGPYHDYGGYDYVGGLIGAKYAGLVQSSFWDTQTSGKTISAGGTGRTTAQMKTLSTFTSAGWVFNFRQPGHAGNALAFDGLDDYVEVAGYNGISGANPRTVSAWFRTTTPAWQSGGSMPYNMPLVQWGHDSTGECWLLFVTPDRKARIGVRGGGVQSAAVVNDGLWHHIAAVLPEGQASSENMLLYVDGQLDGTPDGSAAINTNTADMPVYIGAYWQYNAQTFDINYFQGLIDDVRIYDRALDAGEINPAALPETGLVAHWAMDETEGTVAHDSVSSYDGQLYNLTATWAICEGTNYPRLRWQIPATDWLCPDGVNVEDLDYLSDQWLLDDCTSANGYCDGRDLDASGSVDLQDFVLFAQYWLEAI